MALPFPDDMPLDILEQLERDLNDAEKAEKAATAKKDGIWKKVFKIFDEQRGPNTPVRVLMPNGMVLERGKTDRVNLHADIAEQELAPEVWGRVTRIQRILDADMLRAAVDGGYVTPAQLQKIVEVAHSYPRLYKPGTKDELALLEVAAQEDLPNPKP